MKRALAFVVLVLVLVAVFAPAMIITGRGGGSGVSITVGNFLLRSVENVTTTKAVAESETFELYQSNDADGQTITLPDNPTLTGLQFTVCAKQVQTSNNTALAPNTGESIIYAGVTATTSCTTTAPGSCLTVYSASTGSGAAWVVLSATGTWTCL